MFETGEDFRRFGEQLGEATDRGELEVHAFSLMSTHYHLLVCSPRGELARAMQRVQTEYSRWFNRGRKRDGPLVRSRYTSKVIDSEEYHRTVVSYIDRNAVDAKLVRRAADHWHGSAREYLGAVSQRTPWLKRDWVERTVVKETGARFDAKGYERVFGELPASLARVVEARWDAAPGPDPLDDLLGRSPEHVRLRFERKARLADGVRPGLPVLDLETLAVVLRAEASRDGPEWKVGRQSGWTSCSPAWRRISAERRTQRSPAGAAGAAPPPRASLADTATS